MNKFIVSAGIVLSLLGAAVASAQSYNYSPIYGAGCPAITSDLSMGSNDTQVRALQSFLVSQNYPGGGAWMVTGHFGVATREAVKIFQGQRGLPQTGYVDTATRAAMCAGVSQYGSSPYVAPAVTYPTYTNPFAYNAPPVNNYLFNNNYGYNYPYTNYNNYNTNCNSFPYYSPCYNQLSTVTLTSLSVTSGLPGSTITVYGTGFDVSNNTVYVGGKTISGVSSWNGSSINVTIPVNESGSVSISVSNGRGTSNALTFNVVGTTGGCGTYPYSLPCGQGCGGYGFSAINCPPPVAGQPYISYLSPVSGGVGTAVTAYGWGFSFSGNTVHFGNGIITNLQSFDGRSVSFTVPSTLSGFGYQPIGLGSYDVSVSNSYGATSNTMPFVITSTGSTGGVLQITSINGPTTLSVGQVGTWAVNVNTQNNTNLTTTVRWGDENTYGYAQPVAQQVSNFSSNAVTFTHAYQSAGTYTITFTISNGQGQSNVSSAMVSVSGNASNSLSLYSILPSSGHTGTQVILQGSGFSLYDNTVHFGVGGTLHVPSQNGTTIYFTIPSYVSQCDVMSGTNCFYAQPVSAGSYPIYVSNVNGNSQTLNFIVN